MKWHENWFPTFHWFHRWWGQRLTAAGRVLFVALLAATPGVITEQRFATELFGGLATAFVIVIIVGRRFRPQLRSRVTLRDASQCGDSLELRVRLENVAATPCYKVLVALEETHRVGEQPLWECLDREFPIVSLRPGESTDVVLRIRPTRRGLHPAPNLRLTTTYPLNLMHRRQQIVCDQMVTVTPAFKKLQDIGLNVGNASCLPAVQETAPQRGESWEYYGSSEYREGMPVRRWDYGAWARLGTPYVREYEEQTQANGVLLVDLSASSQRSRDAFERTVSLAAAIIDALCEHRWQIHCFIADVQSPWIQWETASPAREELLRRLGNVQPLREPMQRWVEAIAATSLPLRELTTYVVFSDWDAARAEAFAHLSTLSSEIRGFVPREIGLDAPAEIEQLPSDYSIAPLNREEVQ